jgi:hypothetical protein
MMNLEPLIGQALTLGLIVGVAVGLVAGWLIHEASGCGRARAVGYRKGLR